MNLAKSDNSAEMFEVAFQLNAEEAKESFRLNRPGQWTKWKSFFFTVAAIIPSLVLIFFTRSNMAIVSALVFVGVFLIIMFLNVLKNNAFKEPEYKVTFLEDYKQEIVANTIFQVKWHRLDSFSETDRFFHFTRLNRHSLIPKRVIPDGHVAELRAYGDKTNQEPASAESPVDLYNHFSNSPAEEIIEFSYHPDDLANVGPRWTEIKDAEHPQPKKNNSFVVFFILTVTALLFLIWTSKAPPNPNRISMTQLILIGAAIITPFLIIIGVSRILRNAQKNAKPEIPPELNKLTLLKNGLLVGDQHGMTLYDWRDIVAIYANDTCYGFKTKRDLLVLFPKRIFRDEDHEKEFITRAESLRQEFQRGFANVVTAVETGNPYQSPMA